MFSVCVALRLFLIATKEKNITPYQSSAFYKQNSQIATWFLELRQLICFIGRNKMVKSRLTELQKVLEDQDGAQNRRRCKKQVNNRKFSSIAVLAPW